MLCYTNKVILTGVHSVYVHFDSKHCPVQGTLLGGFDKWEHVVSGNW